MSICFCTLAIHAPYRQRARRLCADLPAMPWVVLTDQPSDFADLPVRAIYHTPTGPMAADYLAQHAPTGGGRGAAAYHDKRCAIQAALYEHQTAIYLDADSRLQSLPDLGSFPPGIAVLPVVRKSIAEHLESAGSWRKPAFVELATALAGSATVLSVAQWCHEALIAITRDGREAQFFSAWSYAADFMQSRGIFSGEGGVIGLAAHYAGWQVDVEALNHLGAAINHEGGGPKSQ